MPTEPEPHERRFQAPAFYDLDETLRFLPMGSYDDATPAEARARLAAVPGCGPWTVEMTMGFGLGDPDAVILGDSNLPRVVAWALAGETEADDARMQELLEPYRGHRFRLVRLLFAAGVGLSASSRSASRR